MPKTLITENTLTTTVATIEITSGIDASYNTYEFLVMNGRSWFNNVYVDFLIGQGGTYNVRHNSISQFGNTIEWNSRFGPRATSAGSNSAHVLLRAVLLRPSGSSHHKTVFVHGNSNFNSSLGSSIVLAETTVSTGAVDRVKLTVGASSGGTWLAGTRYKLYGYE